MVQPLTVKNGVLAADGAPRRWTSHKIAQNGMTANFDVSADGRSIVAILAATEQQLQPDHMIVATNVLSRTGPPL